MSDGRHLVEVDDGGRTLQRVGVPEDLREQRRLVLRVAGLLQREDVAVHREQPILGLFAEDRDEVGEQILLRGAGHGLLSPPQTL